MKFLRPIVTLFFIYLLQACANSNADSTLSNTSNVHHYADTIYVTEPKSVTGLWMGTYSVTSGEDAGEEGFYYSLGIHKNKTIQVTGLGGDGMTYYGKGTWSLQNDTIFKAQVTTTNLMHSGVSQTITARYDSTNSKLSGVIVNDIDNYKATLELEKL